MSAKAGVFARREVVVRGRVVAARNMQAGAVDVRMACILWLVVVDVEEVVCCNGTCGVEIRRSSYQSMSLLMTLLWSSLFGDSWILSSE